MVVYNVDSTLTEHGHDGHHFIAEQGLVYQISEIPDVDGGLERTEMELEAEGTHHPLAHQRWTSPSKVTAATARNGMRHSTSRRWTFTSVH